MYSCRLIDLKSNHLQILYSQWNMGCRHLWFNLYLSLLIHCRTKEITATYDKYWMILETFSQIYWKRGPMCLLNQVWLYDIQQNSFPLEILFRALSSGVQSWTARKFEILNFVFLSVSSLILQSKVSFGLPWLMKGYLFSYAKD